MASAQAQIWCSGVIDQALDEFPIGIMMQNATLSYIISRCHERHMDDREPKWRDRALAIEFWIATAVVGGSFIVGAWRALQYWR